MEGINPITNIFNNVGINGLYILRKTGKEVDVVAFYQKENGVRSDEDWVSFIDDSGNEHIKEQMTLQFDFKAADKTAEWLDRLKFEPIKLPDFWDERRFQIVKDLVVTKGWTVESAVSLADLIAETLKSKDASHDKID